MATLLPIIGLSNVIGIQYLVTTKRESLLTRSVCIGAAANFVMNMILIHQLYSYGAAIASVISEVIITAVQLYFIRNELSIPKNHGEKLRAMPIRPKHRARPINQTN